MKKLSPFQKFCARFSRKFPGVVSITISAISLYVIAVAIGHLIKFPGEYIALKVGMISAFIIIMCAIVLYLFPRYVGAWKDCLPEEAIKYAREVMEKFPDAAEALEEWIKVAEKHDDGTVLKSWACYFEQMKRYEDSKARFQKKFEEFKAEIERDYPQNPEEINGEPRILH